MFGREPALWLGAIQALVALLVGFGLNITTEQMSLILVASGAIIALLTRRASVPTQTVKDAGTTVETLKAQARVETAKVETAAAQAQMDQNTKEDK